jgi:hypothetical protein
MVVVAQPNQAILLQPVVAEVMCAMEAQIQMKEQVAVVVVLAEPVLIAHQVAQITIAEAQAEQALFLISKMVQPKPMVPVAKVPMKAHRRLLVHYLVRMAPQTLVMVVVAVLHIGWGEMPRLEVQVVLVSWSLHT